LSSGPTALKAAPIAKGASGHHESILAGWRLWARNPSQGARHGGTNPARVRNRPRWPRSNQNCTPKPSETPRPRSLAAHPNRARQVKGWWRLLRPETRNRPSGKDQQAERTGRGRTASPQLRENPVVPKAATNRKKRGKQGPEAAVCPRGLRRVGGGGFRLRHSRRSAPMAMKARVDRRPPLFGQAWIASGRPLPTITPTGNDQQAPIGGSAGLAVMALGTSWRIPPGRALVGPQIRNPPSGREPAA